MGLPLRRVRRIVSRETRVLWAAERGGRYLKPHSNPKIPRLVCQQAGDADSFLHSSRPMQVTDILRVKRVKHVLLGGNLGNRAKLMVVDGGHDREKGQRTVAGAVYLVFCRRSYSGSTVRSFGSSHPANPHGLWSGGTLTDTPTSLALHEQRNASVKRRLETRGKDSHARFEPHPPPATIMRCNIIL